MIQPRTKSVNSKEINIFTKLMINLTCRFKITVLMSLIIDLTKINTTFIFSNRKQSRFNIVTCQGIYILDMPIKIIIRRQIQCFS